jgi:hypothetical protein
LVPTRRESSSSIGPYEEGEFEFVALFFKELRTFITEAAAAGHGAVVTMG